MSKVSIPIQPIDFELAKRTVDEFSTQRNVPSQVFPQAAKRAEEGRGQLPVAPPAPRTPTRKFTVDLPEYVIDAIHQRALSSRPKQTARYVVLEALQALGLDIQPDDMVRDGRRSDS